MINPNPPALASAPPSSQNFFTTTSGEKQQHVRKMDYVKFQKLGNDAVDLSSTKKYYWVVDSQRRIIAYYKNDQALKPKRTIAPTDIVSARASQSGQGRVHFILLERRGAKMIQMRFKQRTDRDQWLAAIRTVLQLAASDVRVHDVANAVRRHLGRASHDLGFQIACDIDELAHQEALFPFFIEAIESGTELMKKAVAQLSGRGMSLAALIRKAVIHVNFVFEPLIAQDPSSHVPFAGTCYDPAAKQLEIGVDLVFPTDSIDLTSSHHANFEDALAHNDDDDGFADISSPALRNKHKTRTINVSQATSMLSSQLWRNPEFDKLVAPDEQAQASAEISRLLSGGINEVPPCFRFSLQWSHTLHESTNEEAVEQYVREHVNEELLTGICDMIHAVVEDDRKQSLFNAANVPDDGQGAGDPFAGWNTHPDDEGTASSSPQKSGGRNSPDQRQRNRNLKEAAADRANQLPATSALYRYIRGVGIQIDGVSVQSGTPPHLSLILANWDDQYVTAAVAMTSRVRRLQTLKQRGFNTSMMLQSQTSLGSAGLGGGTSGGAGIGSSDSNWMGRQGSSTGGPPAVSAISQLHDRILDIVHYARVAHACKVAEAELSAKLRLHDPVSIRWESLADSLVQNSLVLGGMSPTSPAIVIGGDSGVFNTAARRGTVSSPSGQFYNSFAGSSTSGSGVFPAKGSDAANSGTASSQAVSGSWTPIVNEQDLVPLIRATQRILGQRYATFSEHAEACDLADNLRRIVRKVRIRFVNNSSGGDVALLSPVIDRGVITDSFCIIIDPTNSNNSHAQTAGVAAWSPATAIGPPEAPSFLDAPLSTLLWHASVFGGFSVGNLLSWFRGLVSVASNLVPFTEYQRDDGRGGDDESEVDSEVDDGDGEEGDIGELVAFERTLEGRIVLLDDAVNAAYDSQAGADASFKIAVSVIQEAMNKLNALFPGQRVSNHDLSRVVGMTLRKCRVLFSQRANILEQQQKQQQDDPTFRIETDKDVAILKQYCEFEDTRRMVDALVKKARRDRRPVDQDLDAATKRPAFSRPKQAAFTTPTSSNLVSTNKTTTTKSNAPYDNNDDSSSSSDEEITIEPDLDADGNPIMLTVEQIVPTPGASPTPGNSKLPTQQHQTVSTPSARIVITNKKGQVVRQEQAEQFAQQFEQQQAAATSNSSAAAAASSSSRTSRGNDLTYIELASIVLQDLMPLEAALSFKSRRNVLFLGVDDSGKTLLIESMREEFAGKRHLPLTEPNIGLTTTLVPFCDWVIGCRELGGRAQQRTYIKEFEPMLADHHGIVFVVDAARRDLLPAAKEYLHQVMCFKKLLDLPALLLVNNSLHQRALAVDAVVDRLDWLGACRYGAHAKHKECACSVVSPGAPRRGTFDGSGAREGVLWLCKAMKVPEEVKK